MSSIKADHLALAFEDAGKEARAEIISISPALAAEWLSRSVGNRRLNPYAVQAYADDMRCGAWQLNGETIKFSVFDVLLDGHHRLQACVKACVSFDAWVIRGVDPSTVDTMDAGKVRSVGDQLFMHGVQDAGLIAGATRWIMAIRRIEDWGANARTVLVRFRRMEVLEEAGHLGDLAAERQLARQLRRLLPIAPMAALIYLLTEADPDFAPLFFDALRLGSRLTEDDPVHVLRERLLSERIKREAFRAATDELVAMVIRAWNLSAKGEKVSALRGSVRSSATGQITWPSIRRRR